MPSNVQADESPQASDLQFPCAVVSEPQLPPPLPPHGLPSQLTVSIHFGFGNA